MLTFTTSRPKLVAAGSIAVDASSKLVETRPSCPAWSKPTPGRRVHRFGLGLRNLERNLRADHPDTRGAGPLACEVPERLAVERSCGVPWSWTVPLNILSPPPPEPDSAGKVAMSPPSQGPGCADSWNDAHRHPRLGASPMVRGQRRRFAPQLRRLDFPGPRCEIWLRGAFTAACPPCPPVMCEMTGGSLSPESSCSSRAGVHGRSGPACAARAPQPPLAMKHVILSFGATSPALVNRRCQASRQPHRASHAGPQKTSGAFALHAHRRTHASSSGGALNETRHEFCRRARREHDALASHHRSRTEPARSRGCRPMFSSLGPNILEIPVWGFQGLGRCRSRPALARSRPHTHTESLTKSVQPWPGKGQLRAISTEDFDHEGPRRFDRVLPRVRQSCDQSWVAFCQRDMISWPSLSAKPNLARQKGRTPPGELHQVRHTRTPRRRTGQSSAKP